MHRRKRNIPYNYYWLTCGTPKFSGFIFRIRSGEKTMVRKQTWNPRINRWELSPGLGVEHLRQTSKEEIIAKYPELKI